MNVLEAAAATMPPMPARSHLLNDIQFIDYSPAYPDWSDLTGPDIADHREWCEDGCSTCDGHREWGDCVACGRSREIVAGVSVCCGERAARPGGPGSEAWAMDGAV